MIPSRSRALAPQDSRSAYPRLQLLIRSIRHQLHKGESICRRFGKYWLEELRAGGSELDELVHNIRARFARELHSERAHREPERTDPGLPAAKRVGTRLPTSPHASAGPFGKTSESQKQAGIRPMQNKESAFRFRNVLIIGGMDFLGAAIVHQLNSTGFQEITITDDLDDSTCGKIAPLKFREFLTREEYDDAAKSRFRPFSDYSHIFYLPGWADGKLGAAKSLFSATSRTATRFIAISSAASLGPRQQCPVGERHIPENFRPVTQEGLLAGLFDRHACAKLPGKGYLSLKHYQMFGPGEPEDGGIGGLIKVCHRKFHACGQIHLPAAMAPETPEGRRLFDFAPVQEVAGMAVFLAQSHLSEGVYEIGSGRSCTPVDLVNAALSAMDGRNEILWDPSLPFRPPSPQPEKACLRRLAETGWEESGPHLESAVRSYVTSYLIPAIELGNEPPDPNPTSESKAPPSQVLIPQRKKMKNPPDT